MTGAARTPAENAAAHQANLDYIERHQLIRHTITKLIPLYHEDGSPVVDEDHQPLYHHRVQAEPPRRTVRRHQRRNLS